STARGIAVFGFLGQPAERPDQQARDKQLQQHELGELKPVRKDLGAKHAVQEMQRMRHTWQGDGDLADAWEMLEQDPRSVNLVLRFVVCEIGHRRIDTWSSALLTTSG